MVRHKSSALSVMATILGAAILALAGPTRAADFHANAGYFLDPTNNATYQRQMGQATYPVPVWIAGQQVYITDGGNSQRLSCRVVYGFSV